MNEPSRDPDPLGPRPKPEPVPLPVEPIGFVPPTAGADAGPAPADVRAGPPPLVTPPAAAVPPPPLWMAGPHAPAPPMQGAYQMAAPPPPPPPSGSRRGIWVAVAVVTLVCVGVGAVAWRRSGRSVPPGRVYESAEQRREAAKAAFGTAAGDDDDAAAAGPQDAAARDGVRALLTRFTAAAGRRDVAALADCFDFDRMADEVAAASPPDVAAALRVPRERTDFAAGFRTGLGRSADIWAWLGFDLRQVRPVPGGGGGEVVAFVRSTDKDGNTFKWRFWARRTGGKWRIYDYEDLSFGSRVTTLSAAAMGGRGSAGPGLSKVTAAIRDGRGHFNAGRNQEAHDVLTAAGGQSVPPQFEAIRLTMLASAHQELGQHAEALAACDQAAAANPDVPTTELIRAAALNALGKPADALAAVDRYEQALGPEGMSWYRRGEALLALGREPEAAAAFRKGLDDSPQLLENLYGLCQVVGSGGTAELRQRFAPVRNKVNAVRAIGNLAIQHSRPDELAAVLELAEGLDPAESAGLGAVPAYFRAELHVLRGEWARAVEVFERNRVLLLSDPFSSGSYPREYGVALLRADRPLDAYRQHTDKSLMLVRAGDRLHELGRADELERLVELHVPRQPSERPILDHYRGLAAELRGRPADAERLLRSALKASFDKEWTAAHRSALIRVMYKAGRAAEAYRTLEPKAGVFEELVGWARKSEKPGPAIRALVALRRSDAKTDPVLDWHLADAALYDGDNAAAADLLLKRRDALAAAEALKAKYPPRLVRVLVRAGRPADAVAEVRRFTQEGRPVDYVAMLAFAAAGDVPEATRRIDQYLAEDGEETLADLLEGDADLDKALSAPAFARWRADRLKPGPPAPAGEGGAGKAPGTRPATNPVAR